MAVEMGFKYFLNIKDLSVVRAIDLRGKYKFTWMGWIAVVE